MRLYDTLSRSLQELPAPPGPIRMYVCGSTVYKRVHIGNARPFTIAMWLRAWLRQQGYEVKLVHNITDVDDHVYEEAVEEGIGSRELAEKATAWFLEDTDDLGLGRPDVEPRASETIPEILALTQELIGRGLAYEAQGDVYFRVASFPEYGRLSHANLDEMRQQEPNPLKEDPRDFALWKAQKPGEDAAWESPWGPGRPGWHIECSAMADKHLGPVFEIHGGGLDLRFPHHENELAQSRGTGREFARVWMHNGMLEASAEKMSKSLGNDVSLRNVLDTWGRRVVLLFLLSGHWRKPLDFTDETLEQARAQLETFRNVFRSPSEPVGDWAELEAALEDDFNTPEALAAMHGWRDHELLRRAFTIFGLESIAEVEEAPVEVSDLAERRREARAAGDFPGADRLRDEIAAAGWEVRDVAEPPGYRLVRRS
jgi:cysteinyl-tRNA synthetase